MLDSIMSLKHPVILAILPLVSVWYICLQSHELVLGHDFDWETDIKCE